MSQLGCFPWLLLAATFCGMVSLVATTSSAGNDEFRLAFLNVTYSRRRKMLVVVNYTAPAKADVELSVLHKGAISTARPSRHYFKERKGQVIYNLRSRLAAENPAITFNTPETTQILFLNDFTGKAGEDRFYPIPDVHFVQPEGDIIYAQTGDVSANLSISTEGGPVGVSYTAYVKDGLVFRVSDDWPVTVIEEATSAGSSALFRLVFNTTERRPEGFLVLKASNMFSPEVGGGPTFVKGLEIEKVIEFYQEGSQRPLTPDTLAFVRGWGEHGRGDQVCDLNQPQPCTITCTTVGPTVTSLKMEDISGSSLDRKAVTTSSSGFRTRMSVPLDVNSDDVTYYGCTAFCNGSTRVWCKKQSIRMTIRQRPDIVEASSSAVLHPNQTLEVRCIAKGHPVPTITFTTPDDPRNTPMEERFPNESFMQVLEFDHEVRARYFLSKASVTSSLTQMQCSADNGYKNPDVLVMPVVPAA